MEKGIGLSDILWVVFAVAERRDSGNSSSVLPAELVSKFVEEKASEIGKHLRGKVFPRKHIPPDPPTESAPAAPDKTDIGNGAPGQTIGIAVGVVVALLVIVLVFFFWRYVPRINLYLILTSPMPLLLRYERDTVERKRFEINGFQ